MRIRLRFAKLGKVRFTSHRDVARMWERALRRTSLPVAYSGGFAPRPKLSFGLALSTGHESVAEFLDVALDEPGLGPVELAALPDRLSDALPVGIDVLAVGALDRGPSLQEDVASCSWRIEIAGADHTHVEHLVGAALAADELVLTRTRKGREVVDDLRPAVLALSVADRTGDGTTLAAELAVHPRSVRPAELLRVLAPDGALEERRVRRTAQWLRRDGAREEPLPAAPIPDATLRPLIEVPSASRREHPDGRTGTEGGRRPPDEVAQRGHVEPAGAAGPLR